MCKIIIIIYSLEFFTSALTDGFSPESEWHKSQVSRTLLNILAVLNNVVVWMVFTRLPTSKSSSPFSNPLVTVPNRPITIGVIVTGMFHSFFNSLARLRCLSFFSHSFSIILWSAGTANRNTWNYITMFKSFVLDMNTWNYTTMPKLFVLDKNTSYDITVCKQMLIIDK